MIGEKTRILLVEDSDDLAEILSMLLESEPDMECARRLASAEGLDDAVAEVRPGVVLLDLTMPGPDPMDVMERVAERCPEARFIVLSGHDDPARVDEAVDRGAWGFVSKNGDLQRLLAAIRAVAAGEVYLKGVRG